MEVSSRRRAWRMAITALEGDWKEKAQLPGGEQEVLQPGVESRLCTIFTRRPTDQSEIIDFAAEGIIVCDRELRCHVWNHFMEQLTGRRAVEALGKSVVELFPSPRENAMEAALSRGLRAEVVQTRRLSAPAEDRFRRLGILYRSRLIAILRATS